MISRRSADEAVQQVVELAGRVVGEAAVDRAGLEHRAARRLEEAEPLAHRGPGGATSSLVAGADRVDEGQGLADPLDVEPRVERAQPVGVDLPGGRR